MQRIYALRIAMQDRPKTFQRIVLGLFFLSVFTVLFSAVSLWQDEQKGEAQQQAKNPAAPAFAQRPLTYSSASVSYQSQR